MRPLKTARCLLSAEASCVLAYSLSKAAVWRWFTGLGFDQEIPHHSTFSKNRHGRFQESNLFQEMFERMVDQCISADLVNVACATLPPTSAHW